MIPLWVTPSSDKRPARSDTKRIVELQYKHGDTPDGSHGDNRRTIQPKMIIPRMLTRVEQH